jgi:hypothetical protein
LASADDDKTPAVSKLMDTVFFIVSSPLTIGLINLKLKIPKAKKPGSTSQYLIFLPTGNSYIANSVIFYAICI